MTRRDWLTASGALTGSALTAIGLLKRPYSRDVRPKHSRVAILHVDDYSDRLDELLYDGLRLFKLNLRGKAVLLKPNLVDNVPGDLSISIGSLSALLLKPFCVWTPAQSS